MNDCVFCKKIASGGDEHGKVRPTTLRQIVCFGPLNPVTEGHMLFAPRDHHARAVDSPLALIDAMEAAVHYARMNGVEDYNLIQSNGAPATQTVDHVHVHLVPREEGDTLLLPWTPKAEHCLEHQNHTLTTHTETRRSDDLHEGALRPREGLREL